MKAAKPKKKHAPELAKARGKRITKRDFTQPREKIPPTLSKKDVRREKFAEKARQKLKETSFNKDGLREISLPLHSQEWDFSAIPKEEQEFAIFWEYRRDKIEFYDGLAIEEANGRCTPNYIGGDAACAIFWGLNWELFPLPYMEVRGVLEKELPNIKLCSTPDTPAISELEIDGLAYCLANPEGFNLKLIRQIGTKKFWNKFQESKSLSVGGPLSIHCFQVNWEKPKKEIWEAFRNWVQEMKMDRKKIGAKKGRLLQLGVARAKRAGMSSKQFGDRFEGSIYRRKCDQKMNLYDDTGSFSKAAKTAESELAKTQRFPVEGIKR
jgi:hypothetical protein